MSETVVIGPCDAVRAGAAPGIWERFDVRPLPDGWTASIVHYVPTHRQSGPRWTWVVAGPTGERCGTVRDELSVFGLAKAASVEAVVSAVAEMIGGAL